MTCNKGDRKIFRLADQATMTQETQNKTASALRVINDFRDGKLSREETVRTLLDLGAKMEDAIYMTSRPTERDEGPTPSGQR